MSSLFSLHQKLPPVADENKYRDPQSDITQNVKVLGILTLKWDVSIKSLPQSSGNPTEEEMEKNVRVTGNGKHQENKAI